MATKEDINPDSLQSKSMEIEDTKPVLEILAAAASMPREERSQSALDLRTGIARKRSYSGDDETDGSPRSKLIKRKPTDSELALNLFIKQLAVEWLDRRLTIVQQPRHRLAQLESACQRQFPAFSERQIRLKIRGQLKLYRRNLKKAEERRTTKSGVYPGSRPAPADWSPLNSIDQQPTSSYLACNPNALLIARRALANERKRGTPLAADSKPDLMPLKVLSDWQNIGILGLHSGMNKQLPMLRPNSSLATPIHFPRLTPTNMTPPIRVQSNPSMVAPMTDAATSAFSATRKDISPRKPIQTNNSALTLTSSGANSVCKVESVDSMKPADPNISMVDSSILSSSSREDSNDQKTPLKFPMQLPKMPNQLWPPTPSVPSVSVPFPIQPADPSATMIASCLRLAANFLLQSASFFESKNSPLPDLNHALFPPPPIPFPLPPQPPHPSRVTIMNPLMFDCPPLSLVQPLGATNTTSTLATAPVVTTTGVVVPQVAATSASPPPASSPSRSPSPSD